MRWPAGVGIPRAVFGGRACGRVVPARRRHSVEEYGVYLDSDSVMDELRAFVAARDWDRFHTPQNLAKSVSIEAAQLLELFF